MKIAVFGLGYVGTVTMAALAGEGHDVTGVDPNPVKVDLINSGSSPIIEEGLGDLIRDGIDAGRIRALTSPVGALADIDICIVCVGTPSRPNGSVDLRFAVAVCQEIGAELRDTGHHPLVLIRSTMVPGSTETHLIPALEEASGRRAGEGFGVAYNPEFLREGTSLRDFHQPPFTIIGCTDDRAAAVAEELYRDVEGDLVVAPIAVAEMLKYASNSYHALKVAFANEIGAICDRLDVDGRVVMDLFARDDKLNISRAYLRPGFAFGGSCLPKDLRALVHHARSLDVEVPLLESVSVSNHGRIERALAEVLATGHRKIGLLGLSFKAGTDDLRESPAVELAERLIGKGMELAVFDRNVSLANLHGSNREFIDREIPHIASLMKDTVDEVVAASDVLVICNGAAEFRTVPDIARPGQAVFDLVGVTAPRPEFGVRVR